MLKIALCDDDTSERAALKAMVDEFLARRGLTAWVREFGRGKALLGIFEMEGPFDIYLLDVIMPEMDGIHLGLTLREGDKNGIIIYLTTSPDFALESYSARAFHYLLKPVTGKAIFPVLDEAVETLRKRRTEGIQVRTREGTVRLLFDDIYYAELAGRAVRYVCKGGTVTGVTLEVPFREAVVPLLADRRFHICGASFVVNMYHIQGVDKTGATLSTGQKLLLPKSSCTALLNAWSDYWLEGDERK